MSEETLEDQLRKLANDKDLIELNKELMEFNLFDVFDMRKNEKRHSAVLRWLLDPTENHGLNDFVLKRYLIKVTILKDEKR